MLNIYFFGYLPLKFRRLIRFAVFLDFILYTYIFYNYFKLLVNNLLFDVIFVLVYCIVIALISWVLKLFVINK